MNKIAQTFVILTVFFVTFPALGQADIVYLKTEDKLFGTIQNPSFIIQARYGKVSVPYDFIKSIQYRDASNERWDIETINNDHFSGFLLNDNILFMPAGGNQKTIKKEQIKRMRREIIGPSRRIKTTIFTMKNGDRFSGKCLHRHLEIQTNYMTKTIQAAEINRIEFIENNPSNIKILLKNGDLLEGTLKQNQFHLMPSAGSRLNVTKSSLKSIQFNAPKLVLRESNGSLHAEEDSDGDGVPDYADICLNTPVGAAVEQDGCAKKIVITDSGTENEASWQSDQKTANMKTPSYSFTDIQFDFDRFELTHQYRSVLAKVAVIISQDSDIKIEIQGHADNIGSEGYNQILSEKRASIVKNYFVQKGIDQDRLFPVGFGDKMSKATNKTEAGRALNRRVELIVQDPGDRL